MQIVVQRHHTHDYEDVEYGSPHVIDQFGGDVSHANRGSKVLALKFPDFTVSVGTLTMSSEIKSKLRAS
jgi:hypothetical protein